MECRKETAYALHKTPITKMIREKEYHFLITTAHCKECGCEVGVKGILDYNAKEVDEQFRKAEGIISLEEIERLGKIYNLGKAPLSIALGFGEVTITRYLAGQIPSKEYSDIYSRSAAVFEGSDDINVDFDISDPSWTVVKIYDNQTGNFIETMSSDNFYAENEDFDDEDEEY